MMATTQPEDIPQTIRSRCQHFSFHAVKYDDILTQLKTIAAAEQIEAEAAALALLAEAGDGSMRDALSIMDQAIASAPLVNGNAHLESEQIRELMGSVPNTVFERLLEQVSAGQTAAVVEELNTLLNAGNSPSALARQFVRYLRNALMAKVGGENTDLLQISADERARAMRSAHLFSEEDLTRFLQVMLRTFDEMNYRQEQRFHLELGLVKLVHLQRLLPLEEILSGAGQGTGHRVQGAGGGGASTGLRASGSAQGTGPRAQSSGNAVPVAAPSAARPSPFETDRDRKVRGEAGSSAEPAARGLSPAESVARAAVEAKPSYSVAAPAPESKPPVAVGMAEARGESTEGALVLAPAVAVAPPAGVAEAAPDLDRIREAVVAALASSGHETAANLIHQGNWTQEGNAIQVVLAVRKTMLTLTVNGEAEAIVRKTMKAMGATQKIAFVPGENGNGSKGPGREGPAPLAGSAQSAAMENPLVKKTQELFKADIRSVLDLRDKG
jgi:DNA polymerase-3 subunit gamma/tau